MKNDTPGKNVNKSNFWPSNCVEFNNFSTTPNTEKAAMKLIDSLRFSFLPVIKIAMAPIIGNMINNPINIENVIIGSPRVLWRIYIETNN